MAAKIKYAKYHALRIAKAIKAGEDPNLSNPAPEPEQPPLDLDDPDVQMLNGTDDKAHSIEDRQPSVVEISDEEDQHKTLPSQRSMQAGSSNLSGAPSIPSQISQPSTLSGPEEDYYHVSTQPEVSPLDSTVDDRRMSGGGGGYFPRVPDSGSYLPDAPLPDPGSPPIAGLPDVSSLPRPSSSGMTSQEPLNNSLHSFPPPSMNEPDNSPPSLATTPNFSSAPPPTVAPSHYSQPSSAPRTIPRTPIQPPVPTPNAPSRHTAPIRPSVPQPVDSQTSYEADEEAILKAQKHARWAISALNFEDVTTAVKELRGALETLGAR